MFICLESRVDKRTVTQCLSCSVMCFGLVESIQNFLKEVLFVCIFMRFVV